MFYIFRDIRLRMRLSSAFRYLGLLGILLLPNHDLFNYLLQNTPLTAWKQSLAFIFGSLSVVLALGAKERYANGISVARNLFIFYIAFGSIFAIYSLVLDVSLFRVVYGLMAYVGFAGYLYYAFYFSNQDRRFAFYRIIALVSLFCSIGLTVDYFTNWLIFLPRSGGVDDSYYAAYDQLKRVGFFFGASTLTFPFQGFGLTAAGIWLLRKSDLKRFFLYLLFASANIYSSYLTGSRATFYLTIFCFIAFLYLSFALPRKKSYVLVRILLTIALSIFLINYLTQSPANFDRYISVASSDDPGNLNRFAMWSNGWSLMFDIDFYWFLGHGLGSTLGNLVDGYNVGSHFESSFFQAFYEGGPLLVFYRYSAVIFSVYIYLSNSHNRTPETSMLVILLILISISTLVAPTYAAYHNQSVIFIVSGLVISLSRQRR